MTRIHSALKSAGASKRLATAELVGCSIEELFKHLGPRVLKLTKLTLHIDHIWPCKLYDLTDPEQQRMCFNYRNLRLCRRKTNMSKGSKPPGKMLRYFVPRHLWPPQFQ